MSGIKCRLVVELPGAVMFKENECKEGSYTEKHSMKINHKGQILTMSYHTRKSKPAYEYVDISGIAYKAMTTECPYFIKPGTWKRMNAEERLKVQLERTAEALGGRMASYQMFKD